MLFKDLVKIGMVGAEGSLELGQAFFDLVLGKGQDPVDDVASTFSDRRGRKTS